MKMHPLTFRSHPSEEEEKKDQREMWEESHLSEEEEKKDQREMWEEKVSLFLQETVSAAVLPLWANPELASLSPDMAQRIISILTKCTRGTQGAAAAQPRPTARQQAHPDPATVQTIVEMGFSAGRAQEALRRVCHALGFRQLRMIRACRSRKSDRSRL